MGCLGNSVDGKVVLVCGERGDRGVVCERVES